MKIKCAIAERGMEAVCFPDYHPQERPPHETPNAEWYPLSNTTPKNDDGLANAERGMVPVLEYHPQERPMHDTPNAEWNPSPDATP